MDKTEKKDSPPGGGSLRQETQHKKEGDSANAD